MNPLITEEQRQALHDAQDRGPVMVVDPTTNVSYVLLRSDLYDRCRALFTEEEFAPKEAYPVMDDVARQAGWLDPEMDAYDQIDPSRQSADLDRSSSR